MLFKYYSEVISNEHMLYAHEIATMYGLFSKSDRPHKTLVKTMILDFLSIRGVEYQPLYYSSKNGLIEVFPKCLYHEAVSIFLANTSDNIYISRKNKKFIFKRKGD